jgi:hypothetical protein
MVADAFNVPFQGSFAVEDQDVAGSRLAGQLIRVKQPPTGHGSQGAQEKPNFGFHSGRAYTRALKKGQAQLPRFVAFVSRTYLVLPKPLWLYMLTNATNSIVQRMQ